MSVMQDIVSWLTKQPYWEQRAYEMVLKRHQPTSDDLDTLLGYFLEDADLCERSLPRPTPGFLNRLYEDEDCSDAAVLVSLSDLENVNALLEGQSLEFSPSLTAIYGANGAGKSGYARVLGCAGFTRGDRQVLPNVDEKGSEDTPQSARIVYHRGGQQTTIDHDIKDSCDALAGVYAFDSTSVSVHLTGTNEMSFSPAGLSTLTELAEMTDLVRNRFDQVVAARTQPHGLERRFQGSSTVTELVTGLGKGTDEDSLRSLACYGHAEEQKSDELRTEIARLRALDIDEELARVRRTLRDAQGLAANIRKTNMHLSKPGDDEIIARVLTVKGLMAEVASLDLDSLKDDRLSSVGTEEWRQFVSAALALAQKESTSSKPYPADDSICLLCHQRLGADAKLRLEAIWRYLRSDAQTRLTQAQRVLASTRASLVGHDLSFFSKETVAHRLLTERNSAVAEQLSSWIASVSERQQKAGNLIDKLDQDGRVPQCTEFGLDAIEKLIGELEAEIGDLEKKDVRPALETLSRELLELDHRKVLSSCMDDALAYVHNCRWAAQAQGKRSNTRHITRQYNRMFSALVTERYKELFMERLAAMGRPMNVHVETRGRKGTTTKHLVVSTSEARAASAAPPDKVFSEGEKRMIALADFLTESQLDAGCGCLVLDDPVTSLDLEWRDRVAGLLAEEAANRQVIVFTHDLPFLYYLVSKADNLEVECRSHWIERTDDGVPGRVSADNSPASEQEYKTLNRVERHIGLAQKAVAEERQYHLQQGFAALRTCYEYLVVFVLLNGVVQRFEERISIGRLKDISWDDAIAAEIDEKQAVLSRYIEGHLHSNTMHGSKPSLEDLRNEKEEFSRIKREIRNLKNEKKNA